MKLVENFQLRMRIWISENKTFHPIESFPNCTVAGKTFSSFFYILSGFSFGHRRFTGQQEKGCMWPSLFLSTTSTRSRTFIHLFATLHVRWLPRIFNHTTCNYQTWRFTTFLNYHWIDLWWNVDFCLILDLVTAILTMGKWCIWTRIDYHPTILDKI